MTSVETIGGGTPQNKMQPGAGGQAPAVPQAPAAGSPPQGGGLPPTGLMQQEEQIQQFYEGVQQSYAGFDPRGEQYKQLGNQEWQPQEMAKGSTSLDQMARSFAQQYRLPIGRGRLVDEYGNFLVTPEEMAASSGGAVTTGEAAAKMNYISQAITRKQNADQQQMGRAAIETGMGLVQSRGRGSLAAMQSGFYQDLADLYSNEEYEAADFSYFIQQEQLNVAADLQRRQEKLFKEQSRQQFIIGAIQTILGAATGNVGTAVAGAGTAAASAEGTGWF